MRQCDLCVVVPMYKTAPHVAPLFARLLQATERAGLSVHVVFVDDNCPEQSYLEVEQLRDPRADLVRLSQNCGQWDAVRAGLTYALDRSDCAFFAVMDGDQQDPPEALPDLVDVMTREGSPVAFALRQGAYQSGSRMLSGRIFKMIIRRLSGMPKGAGGYLVMRRKLVQKLVETPNSRFYLPGLAALHASSVSQLRFDRAQRQIGASSYTGAMRLSAAYNHILCILIERRTNVTDRL